MKFSYVLPDPASYRDWTEFEGDLVCGKQAGYDAVELQIADPTVFDEARMRQTLAAAGLPLCAFQTGASYATRGNCLCSPDAAVRQRTITLLRAFADLAARWQAIMVVGSLQGRLKDEPDREVGSARIAEGLHETGAYATRVGAVIAFEPVNHGEIGFHNTIAEAAALVRRLAQPGLRLMVDSFHMNIEEQDMIASLAGVREILAHVHLSETNRDLLGTGHWPTSAFLAELNRLHYAGVCSVGVYNSRLPRRTCISRCKSVIDAAAFAALVS